MYCLEILFYFTYEIYFYFPSLTCEVHLPQELIPARQAPHGQGCTPRATLKSQLRLCRREVPDAASGDAAWLVLNICLICKCSLPVTAWGQLQMSFPGEDTVPLLFPLG